MKENELSKIDAAFQQKLLEALASVHHELTNQPHSAAELRRARFLNKWYQTWIAQDLSAISQNVKS